MPAKCLGLLRTPYLGIRRHCNLDPNLTMLCAACNAIPADFFRHDGRLRSEACHPLQGPSAFHLPVALMKQSAQEGCALCVLLSSSIDADWLGTEIQTKRFTELRRGLIEPHPEWSHNDLEAADIGPRQTFSLYVDADDISHGYFFHIPPSWRGRRTPSILASPEDDIRLIRYWIEDCVNDHKTCATAGAGLPQFLPTRLLELNDSEPNKDLRLVRSENIASPKAILYTALSHCWGETSSLRGPTRTTSTNIKQRQVRIPFDELSTTFQDAVRISRGLGVNYLWIDSLCIVQDSKDDWEAEASKMGHVYANSYCTLAASSSQDSGEGCIRRFQRTGYTEGPRYIDIEKGPYSVRIFEKSPLDWNREFDRGPLRTRAWTLQERELSMRVVHFSQSLLLWECKTMRGSSELPWFQMKHEDPPASLLLNSAADCVGNGESLHRREWWYRMVEDFCARNLTVEMDKLPALAGLAQRDHELRQSRYLAGLWQDDLPSALLWRSSRFTLREGIEGIPASRPTNYRAPSWSWASVNGSISYDSQRIWQSSSFDVSNRQSEFVYHNFHILDTSLNETSHEAMGSVSSGHIRVRGCLKLANIDLVNVNGQIHDNQYLILTIDGTRAGIVYPDSVAEFNDRQIIYCLRVRDEVHHTKIEVPSDLYEDKETCEPMIMGLALSLLPDDKNTYQRVGLVRFMKLSCFNGEDISELILI